jgi:subtilase family serine protease
MPSHHSAAPVVSVCPQHVAPGMVTCFAMARANATGGILTSAQPLAAFTPADIQAAYGLTGLKSHGATVAIVDAYGYPTLAADLAQFRSTYGLSPCTIKNKCLQILNQDGGKQLPTQTDPNWDIEQALDVDSVSSACPDCKIIVYEGTKPSTKSLGTAVDTAAKTKGVVAISNSYGGGNGKDQPYYDHPGIAVTASTGDHGWMGGSYPASDSHVTAVGGTSIVKSSAKGRGFTETAWSGAGSGCGKNKTPAWQQKVKTGCKTKAMSDVSAAANPNAGGLNVYYDGHFLAVGGTSEASPIIASVFALSGNTKGYPTQYPYADPKDLNDITSGSNGSCGAPLCDAGKGWDGPTGVGTPNGVKGF